MASVVSDRSPPPRAADPAFLGSAPLLAAVLLLAYGPALRGGMLWDDDAHVTKAALRGWSGLRRIWFEWGATQQYYPVLHSVFWIEHRVWGDATLGYHLINLFWHGLAAWLLVRILRQLQFPAAGLAGLAFAVHPVAVESVAWISEQKNTLSAVFYFAAALGYLRFDTRGPRSRSAYGWALGCFVLALLTKSVTATLPAALLVMIWWRRGTVRWTHDVLPLLPWFAVAAASGTLTAWIERTYIGASGAEFDLPWGQRFLLAARAAEFYAGKVIWPSHLIFIYPRWNLAADAEPELIGLLALGGLLAVLLLRAARRPAGAGRARGPLAALLFFLGTLFPALGFVNVYPFIFSWVADHFQYLAAVGLLCLLAWSWEWALQKLRLSAALSLALMLVWPAVLLALTVRQARLYRDADTLNRATLAENPDAWLAHYNLAVSLGGSPGHEAEALAHYQAAVRLNPSHWAARCNLASALLKAGRIDAAIAQYQAALRINPAFAEAHNDLAIALEQRPGNRDAALQQLREAVRLRPDYDGAHGNLGALLLQEPGTRAEAVAEFQTALRLAPLNAEYHYDLANAWADLPASRAAAVGEYRAALRLRPDYLPARANLAATLLHLPGEAPAAVSEFRAAVKLAPANAQLRVQLAVALIVAKQPKAEAIAELNQALALQPNLAPARRLLERLR